MAAGLAWLALQQTKDGYWEYDGSHKVVRISATGMALLAFLGTGESHLKGVRYKANVAKGLTYLKSQILPTGQFKGEHDQYAHAIAAMALCEAYGISEDPTLLASASKSIDYILKAQAKNGSWGYRAGDDGDTSIVGWQIQALTAAKTAGITVPDKCFKKAEDFLISVSEDNESKYGYRNVGSSPTLTAVGLLSRIHIEGNAQQELVSKGVSYLCSKAPPKGFYDLYYLYYASQAIRFRGGQDWDETWNPDMRDTIIDKQINLGRMAGSWPKDTGFIGSSCGSMGTTAMAVLTLEVYYRHNPLPKREVK